MTTKRWGLELSYLLVKRAFAMILAHFHLSIDLLTIFPCNYSCTRQGLSIKFLTYQNRDTYLPSYYRCTYVPSESCRCPIQMRLHSYWRPPHNCHRQQFSRLNMVDKLDINSLLWLNLPYFRSCVILFSHSLVSFESSFLSPELSLIV